MWSANIQGACTTLLSVRVYYVACPSVLINYANFTETPAGPKMTSIVQRDGACVQHADVADQRPSYLCKADGSWYYATGCCRCRPGYQPDDDAGTQCTGRGWAVLHESFFSQVEISSVDLLKLRVFYYRAMHFSAFARSWDRMSSVCPSVCDVGGL